MAVWIRVVRTIRGSKVYSLVILRFMRIALLRNFLRNAQLQHLQQSVTPVEVRLVDLREGTHLATCTLLVRLGSVCDCANGLVDGACIGVNSIESLLLRCAA